MNKRGRRRLPAWALTLALLAGLLPGLTVPAAAAEEIVIYKDTTAETIRSLIGGVTVNVSEKTITLMKNGIYSMSNTIRFASGAWTLDLNDGRLSCDSGAPLAVNEGAALTLVGGDSGNNADKGIFGPKGFPAVAGKVTLGAGSFNLTGGAGAAAVDGDVTVLAGATVKIFGGNGAKGPSPSEAGQAGGAGIVGNLTVQDGAAVTVTGGKGGQGYGSSTPGDHSDGGNGGAGVDGAVNLIGGTLTVTGGNGGNSGKSGSDTGQFGKAGDGGDALTGGISLTGGTLTLQGGAGAGEGSPTGRDGQASGTLSGDCTVQTGKTLTVKQGQLTIPAGASLTNNGTVAVGNSGTLINRGTLTNTGTLTNGGTLDNYSKVYQSGRLTDKPISDIGNGKTYYPLVLDLTNLTASAETADGSTWWTHNAPITLKPASGYRLPDTLSYFETPHGTHFSYNYNNTTGEVIVTDAGIKEKIVLMTEGTAVPAPPPALDPAPSGGNDDDDDDDPTPTEAAVDAVKDAKAGDTVKLDLPASGKLPSQVLEAAAGKDVTLEIDAGNGVTWIISGKDIPKGKLSALDLKVDTKAGTIPVTVLNALTGEKQVMQLTLSHNGAFPFPLTLRLDAGKDNANLWANLYYYDEAAKTLLFQAAAQIAGNGDALLPFDHASSYAVVIDESSHAPMAFTDVKPGDWCYEAVEYVHGAGLMNGATETAFRPNGPVTRGQLAAILWRMAGAPAPAGAAPFADVPAGAYYADAVAWCAEKEIVGGYGNGAFGPNDPVNRQQLVTILYRYAKHEGRDVSVGEDTNILSYPDAFDVAEWAVPAFQWACGSGVVGGTAEGLLAPAQGATRAQLAVILQRFAGEA